MTAPGSSLGSCRVWVISSFLGLGFFCADTPGTRTRQQAHANSANLFMVLLRFRVAVNGAWAWEDRKSTRLNSSHLVISYAAFCLKKTIEVFNRHVGTTLKDERRGTSGGVRTRLRHALLIAEIPFSLVLLVGAGLMLMFFFKLLGHHPGFHSRRPRPFSV